MANVFNWIEIPATDFNRAKNFYTTILNAEMHVEEMMGTKMAFFNMGEDQTGVGGSICTGEDYRPSTDGTLAYLDGGDDLVNVLNRIENAGGNIVMPKTKITDEIGYIAFFIDTEGNKIGLHSKK